MLNLFRAQPLDFVLIASLFCAGVFGVVVCFGLVAETVLAG